MAPLPVLLRRLRESGRSHAASNKLQSQPPGHPWHKAFNEAVDVEGDSEIPVTVKALGAPRQRERATDQIGGAARPLAGATLVQLRTLAEWGHRQLQQLEALRAEPECYEVVLDEVAPPFRPWAERAQLLRAVAAPTSWADMEEVATHLRPLRDLLGRRLGAQAALQTAASAAAVFDAVAASGGSASSPSSQRCVERCRVVLPALLEAAFKLGLDVPTAPIEACMPKPKGGTLLRRKGFRLPAARRRGERFARVAVAVRTLLDRPDVQQALQGEEARLGGAAVLHVASPLSPGPSDAIPVELPLALPQQLPRRALPEALETLLAEAAPRADVMRLPEEAVENRSGAVERCSNTAKAEVNATMTVDMEEGLLDPDKVDSVRPVSNGMQDAEQMPRSFAHRLDDFPRGCMSHSWCCSSEAGFEVRSATYLDDRRKEPAGPALLELVNVDFVRIGAAGPVKHVANHPDFFPATCRRQGDERFLFVLNWIIPPYQCVIVGALNPESEWLFNGSPQARIWRRFLGMPLEEQRDILKIVFSLEDGPWLVRRVAHKKPMVVGRQMRMETRLEAGRYLEVTADASSEQMMANMAIRALRTTQPALAVLLEGRHPEELPEALLLCTAVNSLDVSRLRPPLPEMA